MEAKRVVAINEPAVDGEWRWRAESRARLASRTSVDANVGAEIIRGPKTRDTYGAKNGIQGNGEVSLVDPGLSARSHRVGGRPDPTRSRVVGVPIWKRVVGIIDRYGRVTERQEQVVMRVGQTGRT